MDGILLLVEDSPDDAELTLRALRRNGFSNAVRVLRDGEEAVDYFRSPGESCDLVLLDIRLPKADGFEVLATIRDRSTADYIPVVILSTSAERRDILRAYAAGANGYVQKPLDYDRFQDLVGRIGRFWLGSNLLPSRRRIGGT